MGLQGFTITMKIEVDLRGLPPERVQEIERAGLHKEIAQELKEELKDDMMVPPDIAERVKTSVEFFEWPLEERGAEVEA